MPRRPRYLDATEAQAALADFVGTRRPKRPRAARPEKVRAEAAAMIVSNDFAAATPHHLVALYEDCHLRVYGALPGELAGQAWLGAASAAAKLVRDEFEGDVAKAIEFVRWTWWREREREQRSRTRGEVRTFRVGWRLQFQARGLLTDYRVEMLRRG